MTKHNCVGFVVAVGFFFPLWPIKNFETSGGWGGGKEIYILFNISPRDKKALPLTQSRMRIQTAVAVYALGLCRLPPEMVYAQKLTHLGPL